MDKLEYIKMVDEKILPSIREKLVSAFDKGFEAGQKNNSIEEYLKLHGLDKSNIVDFGLPSKTKWIYKYNHLLRFEDAKKFGLQFPTREQLMELNKCQLFVEDHNEHKPMYMRGPNGKKIQIGSIDFSFCVWSEESSISENYYVCGHTIKYNDLQLKFSSVYSGESFHTIFVLPEYLHE